MKEEQKKIPFPTTFISANGKNGFFSLYDKVFDPQRLDRIFVLNGGPGTGKSSLLREISVRAAAAGAAVEEICCSSDPSSLDGLLLSVGDISVGVLDGTPPHGRILTCPGVTEELWNMGQFWDGGIIRTHKEKILSLTKKKQLAYKRAFAYLRALGAVKEEGVTALLPHFERERASRQIRHKLQPLKAKGEESVRFFRAMSTKGEVTLPTENAEVQNLLLISGSLGAAEIYLSFFREILNELHIPHITFLSPISPDVPDAIYINESRTLLIKECVWRGEAKGRRIVADRFFQYKEEECKERKTVRESLKALALKELKGAGEIHACLENYYGEGMRFQELTSFYEEGVTNVLSALGLPTDKKRKKLH